MTTQEAGSSFLRPLMPSGTGVCRMEPHMRPALTATPRQQAMHSTDRTETESGALSHTIAAAGLVEGQPCTYHHSD